jgi:seryl-tRNA synthetase
MLDINYIRDNAEEVKTACKNKQMDSSIIDQLLATDKKRRELQVEVDALRKQSNEHVKAIKETVHAGGKPTSEQIAKGKEIKSLIQEIEPNQKIVQETFDKLMYQVPNVPATDVPIGKNEDDNIVDRVVGDLPKFDFEPKQHHELMENLDILDTKRAVKIGGFRSYFLKGDGLLLEQAVLAYALKLLNTAGFTPMSAPILVNEDVMWGTGYLPWGAEDHYYTQDGQILAGTSEVALTAYRMGETLSEKDLPVKMCALSPCFRREIGTHGKDTQGLVRVHQFNKVEQVVYTIADEEETRAWHEKMTGFSEQLLKDLGLPYQVLRMCTGDMGAGQRKKYDIETWFPGQNKYRETHSASYFNDFQARRLNIKYQASDGTTKFVYTLNNTMAATPRLLGAIIENYQQADGSVKVPEVLRPYLGKEVIKYPTQTSN